MKTRQGHPARHRLIARAPAKLSRWLTLLIFAPLFLLPLGPLCGSGILVHNHADHGVHLHAVRSVNAAASAAADHASHHHHDCALDEHSAASHDDEHDREAPEGVLVRLPDHLQRPSAQLQLAKLKQLPAHAFIALLLPPACAPSLHSNNPRAHDGRGDPYALRALRAADRIVRTSNALLI